MQRVDWPHSPSFSLYVFNIYIHAFAPGLVYSLSITKRLFSSHIHGHGRSYVRAKKWANGWVYDASIYKRH